MAIRLLTRARNILIPVALLGFLLGWWQLQRMAEKEALIGDFEDRQVQTLKASLASERNFVRIRTTGQLDPNRHILLDNKIWKGRAGVHVFTPFTSAGTTILVNRGWLLLPPDRSSLPGFDTPATPVTIEGILAPAPEHRQRLGEPDVLDSTHWPQLVTYLDIDNVEAALGTDLASRVIWLDDDDPNGFDGRDWSPVNMTPGHHRAYAVQWFALGLAALIFWLVLLRRDLKRTTL